MRSKTPLQAEKILQAAARLFATHRFHEARMEDIAALAEVGKGTLYRYFKDKGELYLALLQQAAQGLTERLDRVVAGGENGRRQLEEVAEAIIDYFDDNPHLFDLIQHAEAMQKADQEFLWQKTRSETFERVRAIFAQAALRGEFEVADPELGMLVFLGGIRSVIRFGPRPRPAELASTLVSAFLDGNASRAEPRRSAPRSRGPQVISS